MTIMEAINRVDSLKPNSYSQNEKVAWLSKLDGIIKEKVIDTHEGADEQTAIAEYIQSNVDEYENAVQEYMKVNEVDYEEAKANVEFREIKYKEAKEHIKATRNDIYFAGYDANTNTATELLVPAPYDDIYVRWLEAQVDYANGEYGKYNNSITMYNSAYAEYANYYNRKHMPKGSKFKYF